MKRNYFVIVLSWVLLSVVIFIQIILYEGGLLIPSYRALEVIVTPSIVALIIGFMLGGVVERSSTPKTYTEKKIKNGQEIILGHIEDGSPKNPIIWVINASFITGLGTESIFIIKIPKSILPAPQKGQKYLWHGGVFILLP